MKLPQDELTEKIEARWGKQLKHQLTLARKQPWLGKGLIPQNQRMVVDSMLEPKELLVSMIISFDTGPHQAGWWKNSEYDTCWHLSMVGMKARKGRLLLPGQSEYEVVPEDERRAWARVLFQDDVTKAWNEPPASVFDPHRNAPASAYTWHSRVFVNREGQPIIPEGEVYTLKPWAEGDSPEKVFTK